MKLYLQGAQSSPYMLSFLCVEFVVVWLLWSLSVSGSDEHGRNASCGRILENEIRRFNKDGGGKDVEILPHVLLSEAERPLMGLDANLLLGFRPCLIPGISCSLGEQQTMKL